MAVKTSQIFGFLDEHPSFAIERHEVTSLAFTTLRRNLRAVMVALYDGDEDSLSVARQIQRRYFEWLTVPVPFDGAILETLSLLGASDVVGRRWGQLTRTAYDAAHGAARMLLGSENPTRTELRSVISDLRANGKVFKIYCHKRARENFESILAQLSGQFDAIAFLHSPRDYRESEPFDVLVKMGPLRSHGWGTSPDAVLSAPRYETLAQVVWSGCGDETGFGYDPVTGATSTLGGNQPDPILAQGSRHHRIGWVSRFVRTGDCVHPENGSNTGIEPSQSDPEDDDFRFFERLNGLGDGSDKRMAKLVQIDDEHGILYPAHAEVLSLDPVNQEDRAIGHRILGETLTEGMFVIVPLVSDVDLGGMRAGDGQFSSVWKARLREELRSHPGELLRALILKGVDLLNVPSAVHNWAKPPTTVIHAPQHVDHFKILIAVLGIDFDPGAGPRRLQWWQYAWGEIQRTRGEAIQTGLHEQEIIEEQLVLLLRGDIGTVRRQAATGKAFLHQIPAGRPLRGAFRFYPIASIESGFRAPSAKLKNIEELRAFEEWRV